METVALFILRLRTPRPREADLSSISEVEPKLELELVFLCLEKGSHAKPRRNFEKTCPRSLVLPLCLLGGKGIE